MLNPSKETLKCITGHGVQSKSYRFLTYKCPEKFTVNHFLIRPNVISSTFNIGLNLTKTILRGKDQHTISV